MEGGCFPALFTSARAPFIHQREIDTDIASHSLIPSHRHNPLCTLSYGGYHFCHGSRAIHQAAPSGTARTRAIVERCQRASLCSVLCDSRSRAITCHHLSNTPTIHRAALAERTGSCVARGRTAGTARAHQSFCFFTTQA